MKAQKSKAQKNSEARKNAEALKAKKKAVRDAKTKGTAMGNAKSGKGKSGIPQSKKKK